MKVSVTNKDIIKLAAPIALAMLIPQINFLTNNAFLGRYGERELGVNGITGVYYLILSMISYGLSSGIQILMARRAGQGDKSGLAKIFANGLVLSMILSLCLVVITLLLSPLIFGASLRDSENIKLSIHYLYVRSWGLPFLALTQLFNAFYISIGKSKYLIYGSFIATLVNIFFDFSLIFGHFGFPRLGLIGAGIASIIAEFSFCFTMFLLFYINKLNVEFRLHPFSDLSFSISRKAMSVAAPLIIQFLFSIGGWEIFFIFVEHLGKTQLAASQILRSIFGVIGFATWAFASACNNMVSNLIGQGKQNEVISLIVKIAKLSLAYAVFMGVVLLVFSKAFLLLYTNDVALVEAAIPSLRVIVFATFIMAIATVMFNGVVGTGNTFVNLFMEVSCVCIYLVYCYIIIERLRCDLYICWGSEVLYWTTLITGSFIYLKSGRWKGKHI